MTLGSRLVSRSIRLAVFLGIVALGAAGCASGPQEDVSSLRGVLRLNFPTWAPVSVRDLPPAASGPWSAAHPKQGELILTGDFFGRGSTSYAALITKKDKLGRRVRLVVMRPAESGRFETFVLFTESPVDTFPTIEISKANEYQVFLAGQSVTVPVEGVVYVHPDGKEKLFFWNEDRFADIELADASSPDTTQP